MDHVQKIQEDEYEFPYHHLVSIAPFSEYRYLFWGYSYAAYVELVMDSLAEHSFSSVIDIGCGDGRVTRELSTRFPRVKVVGVDYSERALAFARAFTPHVTFATKTDETFDAFVCIEVLEHIPPESMTTFLDEISTNLNAGAVGIITTPAASSPLTPKHYQHFTRESIEQTLGSHFIIERFAYISTESWLVQLIQRCFANRFFILRYQPLIAWLYRFYKRRFLHADKTNAGQIFVVVRKRQETG